MCHLGGYGERAGECAFHIYVLICERIENRPEHLSQWCMPDCGEAYRRHLYGDGHEGNTGPFEPGPSKGGR